MNEKEFDLSGIAEEIVASNKQAVVDMRVIGSEAAEYGKLKAWFDFTLEIYNIVANQAPYQNIYYEEKIKLVKNLWKINRLSTQPALPNDVTGRWYHQIVNVKFRAYVKAKLNRDLPETIDDALFVELRLAREGKLEQHESRILFNILREAIEKFKKDNQFVYARQNGLSSGALEFAFKKILESSIVLEFLDENLLPEEKQKTLAQKVEIVKQVFVENIFSNKSIDINGVNYVSMMQRLQESIFGALDGINTQFGQNLLNQCEEEKAKQGAQEEEKKQAKIKADKLAQEEMIKEAKEKEEKEMSERKEKELQQKLEEQQKKIQLQAQIDRAKKTEQVQENLVEEKQKIVKDDDEIHLAQDELKPAQHEESGVYYEEFSIRDVESFPYRKLKLITGSLARAETRTPEEIQQLREQVRLHQQIEEAEAKTKAEAERKEKEVREEKYRLELQERERLAKENEKKRQKQEVAYQKKLDEKYALDEKREKTLTEIQGFGDELVANKAKSAEDKKKEFVTKYQSCIELFREDNDYSERFQLIVNKFGAIFNQEIQLEERGLIEQEKKEKEAKLLAAQKQIKIEEEKTRAELVKKQDKFDFDFLIFPDQESVKAYTESEIIVFLKNSLLKANFNVIQQILESYKNKAENITESVIEELLYSFSENQSIDYDERKTAFNYIVNFLEEHKKDKSEALKETLFFSMKNWPIPNFILNTATEISSEIEVKIQEYQNIDSIGSEDKFEFTFAGRKLGMALNNFIEDRKFYDNKAMEAFSKTVQATASTLDKKMDAIDKTLHDHEAPSQKLMPEKLSFSQLVSALFNSLLSIFKSKPEESLEKKPMSPIGKLNMWASKTQSMLKAINEQRNTGTGHISKGPSGK